MTTGVALLPELAYLPEVFVLPSARSAIRRRAREVAEELRAGGARVPTDPGDEGRTSAETAAWLAGEGCNRVLVFGEPRDEYVARALAAALRTCSIEPELDLATNAAGDPLVEVTDDVRVLDLPPSPPRDVALDALCREVRAGADELGPERIRLRFPDLRRQPPERAGGAPWGIRLGLDDPEWRDALTAILETALPCHAGTWRVLRGWFDLGVSPLEEMYAGNSLVDRNADLLVNIVP